MKIQNISVTGQVIDYIRQQIIAGTWAVGDRIPSEPQLVEALGVSRASVRSALQYFIGLGVLKSYQGKGTFLVDNCVVPGVDNLKITAEDCRDISKVLEFRSLLEPGLCRIAVQRAGTDVVEALGKCMEEMRRGYDAGNISQFVQADLQFHETICRASENPFAIKSLCRVFQEHYRNHEQMTALFGYGSGMRWHEQILDAFRGRDALRAEACMAKHIQEALDRNNGLMQPGQNQQSPARDR